LANRLVILGHPDVRNHSIANKIIVDELARLEDLEIRELASLYPDFQIDVEAEQQALIAAETIVLQFPFYWYSVPGILKQWLDLVLAYGFAYGSNGTKLHGKRMILSMTIGGPEEAYQPDGYNTYRIDELITPLKQTANLSGMTLTTPVISHSMVFIPGVYNVKEEVEGRANDHARRLIATIGNPD